jgi:sugar lactone lactonase YvrE
MKKSSIRLPLLALCFFSLLMAFYACKKSNSNDSNPAPTISSFSPTSDTVGGTITITGNNFNSTAADNTVKINGVVSTVLSATTTQLTIAVPQGASSGPISVTVNGQTATSSGTFTLQGPVITKFQPSISGIGYPVIISGTNFSSDTSVDMVSINGSAARVISASDTQLIAIVPINASTGKISVTVRGQGMASASDIVIKKLTVTTIAGSGTGGFSDGTGASASFSAAWGIAGDGAGNYYVADVDNNRIRKVTSSGVVTTVAGSNSLVNNVDGPDSVATFEHPFGVALDNHGNIIVTNLGFNNIRMITPGGIVSTIAGDIHGNSGNINATGNSARFYAPLGIVTDANNNIFVADAQNRSIREITPAGVVTTFAGSGAMGSTNGNGTAASFNDPYGLGIDASGNLYVADPGNNNIRKITPAGDVTTFAGNGTQASLDGPALSASFNGPIGIVADHSGNLYVTDEEGQQIRMITSDGVVVTLAGNGSKASVDGVGNFASFFYPLGITIDPDGTMYMIDNGTNLVRKMTVQ